MEDTVNVVNLVLNQIFPLFIKLRGVEGEVRAQYIVYTVRLRWFDFE